MGNFFTAGYIKLLQENCLKNPVYMAQFRQREQNTLPPGWYRVVGPESFNGNHVLSGKTWVRTKIDNDMLGKIVRPLAPKLGTSCLVNWYEVIERTEKGARRERVGVDGKLELKKIAGHS